MELSIDEWHSRLEAASLKQLILLYEMSNLTQSIGPGEGHLDCPDLDVDPKSQHPASFRRSNKRIELSRKIKKHMEHTYLRIHGEDFDDPWVLAKEDGYLFFVVMWDHWQQPFEDLVCCRRFEDSSCARSFDVPGGGNDSSDEDSVV